MQFLNRNLNQNPDVLSNLAEHIRSNLEGGGTAAPAGSDNENPSNSTQNSAANQDANEDKK